MLGSANDAFGSTIMCSTILGKTANEINWESAQTSLKYPGLVSSMWLHRSQSGLVIQCSPLTLQSLWPGLLILWQSLPAYGLEADFEHEDDVRTHWGVWVCLQRIVKFHVVFGSHLSMLHDYFHLQVLSHAKPVASKTTTDLWLQICQRTFDEHNVGLHVLHSATVKWLHVLISRKPLSKRDGQRRDDGA